MDTTSDFSSKTGFWILLATIIPSSMASIDATALNVALPTLQQDLGLSGTDLLWTVNSYALMLAALLLVGGSLGDIYGRKKVFMLGIIIFTLSSLACGMAPSGLALIIARAIQGIGGALMVPGSLSIISALFPTNKRGWAIGIWSMYSAMTTIVGPALGGWLAGMGWWRMIFFINLPLGIFSIWVLLTKVAESKASAKLKPDLPGAVFATLGLAGLTYGFIEASDHGFGNPMIRYALGIGGICLAIFLWVEAKSSHPMVPLRLFRSGTFSGTNLLTLLLYAALGAVLFFFPLNLIQIQGYPESIAGITLLPFALIISGLAKVSGVWVDKIGYKIPLIVGPIITAIGFFCFSLPGLTNGPADFWTTYLPAILIAGVGMGITVVPLTTAVMGCVSNENTGVASGINNTVARTASVLTIAILGSFALFNFQQEIALEAQTPAINAEQYQQLVTESSKFAEAQPSSDWPVEVQEVAGNIIRWSFINTYQLICWIATGLALASALIAWLFIKKAKHVTPI